MNTKPNNWNQDEWKTAMRKILELGYKKDAHWQAFYICDWWDKALSLPLVLTTSLISTLSISQTTSLNDTQTIIMNYVIAASSLFVTGLTTINKFYSYAELKEGHKQGCFNYLRLRSDLILKLTNNDVEFHDFMKAYHGKWLNIREQSPNLPRKVAHEMQLKVAKIEEAYLMNCLELENDEVNIDMKNDEVEIINDKNK